MKRRSARQRFPRWLIRFLLIAVASLSFVAGGSFAALLVSVQQNPPNEFLQKASLPIRQQVLALGETPPQLTGSNGRPKLSPLPAAQEVWNCEVVVVGGSLGGVAAASQSMQSGAVTCLIELTPWLGGQLSSQGVSAVDESRTMAAEKRFSASWAAFKHLIKQQSVKLPDWEKHVPEQKVSHLNSCWVGLLCFPPEAGASAALQLLQSAAPKASGSRWGTAIAFKGAAFDSSGQEITAVYAVRRAPRNPDYAPKGRFSREIESWYSWSSDSVFEKVPMRLQAPPGKRMLVIDATDTGEVVGWAGIPHRVGSDAKATTGEINAADRDNPDCTQAFTYPFALAIHDDRGLGLAALSHLKPEYTKEEHQREYSLDTTPMFAGESLFNYRRIVSTTGNDPFRSVPAPGDVTLVNWTDGNDWNWMNPPLLLTDEQLNKSGQRQNWLGGLSTVALKHAEEHALLFAQWLLENQARPDFPLTYLFGTESMMGTVSGLSMTPYIREGRRILGRSAYGQPEFMMREADLRRDLPGGRDFSKTAIAMTHYDIDIHGCRYRNWTPSWEAATAPVSEYKIRPTQIPLESLIPQGVNNLLIGGKTIAVSHIVNAVTRVHYSEWSIGAAAGSTAGWLVTRTPPSTTPAEIVPKRLMPELQQYLMAQGLRLDW